MRDRRIDKIFELFFKITIFYRWYIGKCGDFKVDSVFMVATSFSEAA